MRASPNIFNKNQGISYRKQAHALFLAGKNLNEVLALLPELKRTTANGYLYEARQIASDPLLL